MRPGGVRPQPVPEPADQIWQAVTPAAQSAVCQRAGHRAAVFCPSGRQDSYRDLDPGYAAQRWLLQLAVHGDPMMMTSPSAW